MTTDEKHGGWNLAHSIRLNDNELQDIRISLISRIRMYAEWGVSNPHVDKTFCDIEAKRLYDLWRKVGGVLNYEEVIK